MAGPDNLMNQRIDLNVNLVEKPVIFSLSHSTKH